MKMPIPRASQIVGPIKPFADRMPLKSLDRGFLILCITGFLVQIIGVGQVYFKYKTTTRIRMLERESISHPRVAVCVRYTDIIDYDHLYRAKGIKLKRTNSMFGVANIQSRLTIRDIFHYTRKEEDLVESVSLRKKEGFVLYNYDKDIKSVLNITKFYLQEHLCYRIEVRDNFIIPLKRITSSLHHSNIMMSLAFNSSFSTIDNFMTIIFYGAVPSVSRYFCPTNDRLYNFDEKKIRNHRFIFAQARKEVHLKEPPYDTHCIRGSLGGVHCTKECLFSLTRLLNRVPFTEIITEPLDIKHINYFDLIDVTRGAIINEAYERCENRCEKVSSCDYDYTLTTIAGLRRDDRPQHDFQIFIKTPNKPTCIMTAEAMISLTEFVVYICSCVDIWFGLSFLSMNPFAFWAERRKKKLRRNRIKMISTTISSFHSTRNQV
jgi:hypothetical protein